MTVDKVELLVEVDALRKRVEDLEAVCAYEARVVEAQTMDVKALSEKRRTIVERSIGRLRTAALGPVDQRDYASSFKGLYHELRCLQRERSTDIADIGAG